MNRRDKGRDFLNTAGYVSNGADNGLDPGWHAFEPKLSTRCPSAEKVPSGILSNNRLVPLKFLLSTSLPSWLSSSHHKALKDNPESRSRRLKPAAFFRGIRRFEPCGSNSISTSLGRLSCMARSQTIDLSGRDGLDLGTANTTVVSRRVPRLLRMYRPDKLHRGSLEVNGPWAEGAFMVSADLPCYGLSVPPNRVWGSPTNCGPAGASPR